MHDKILLFFDLLVFYVEIFIPNGIAKAFLPDE